MMNFLKSPSTRSGSKHHKDRNVMIDGYLSVSSIWICRGSSILAESQYGHIKLNRHRSKFVKVFIERVVKGTKLMHSDSSSFSVYVKKREYLYHVVYDGQLLFICLTFNTYHQQPVDAIFHLLNNVKSAFLIENDAAFRDTLCDLHHSYQQRVDALPVPHKNDINGSTTTSYRDHLPIYCCSDDDEAQIDNLDEEDDGIQFLDNYLIHEQDAHNDQSQTFQTTLNLGTPSAGLSPRHSFDDDKKSKRRSKSKSFMASLSMRKQSMQDLCLQNIESLRRRAATSTSTMRRDSCVTAMSMVDDEDQAMGQNMKYVILKKGWMTKQGGTFKTWRYRYFELWSNGLLNYFDNELKLKKKGCVNIMDEVIECKGYDRDDQDYRKYFASNKESEYGLTLMTHQRQWYFILHKQQVRDEWCFLIQTITFTKIDLNAKYHILQQRVNRLQSRWNAEFKPFECDIDELQDNDDYDIHKIQYDLKKNIKVCKKCKKDITYFKGSDVYSCNLQKVEFIAENIENLLCSVNDIILHRKQQQKEEEDEVVVTASSKKKRDVDIFYKSPRSEAAAAKAKGEGNVVLRGLVKVRLPSKKRLGSKGALSKKEQMLEVLVCREYIKVNLKRDMTAPLIWRYEDLASVQDIKGVYFGPKNADKIKLEDIKSYDFLIMHSSQRRLKLSFDGEKEAYLWYTSINSMYDKWNAVPSTPIKTKHNDFDQMIGL